MKLNNQTGLLLGSLAIASFASCNPAKAATVTQAGFTWDSNNAVTNGSIVQNPGISFTLTGFPVDNTVGTTLGFPNKSTVNLGDNTNRGIIELSWGGSLVENLAGNDFVIYENGAANAPEAFAVAVKQKGGSFTNFLYQFSDNFENQTFATAFDLDSFGIATGESIIAIRIANLISSDTVGAGGQGFLGGGVTPNTGPLGGNITYPSGRFDPDITYAVALNNVVPTAIPFEFSPSLGLIIFGGWVMFGKLKQTSKVNK
ncbi:MAG: hypothetical protein SAL07_23385 [Oscillatoria sp. PMC 1051.18]|nr:hypothetical protein [Oscillatoria sp. PMC 1050.18]MEC5032856.1 hypothetical protein [Oscillatoria sp. PMC 1051.18]